MENRSKNWVENLKVSRSSEKLALIKLSVFFIIILICSVLVGRYIISPREYLTSMEELIKGYELSSTSSILIGVRIPRVLMASLIGAGLSVSGLVFQNVFKNPIASPDILGVTSGASFGAALALMTDFKIAGKVQIFAFAFGLMAIGVTYVIKTMSRDRSILYLVLSGIITSAFFTSLLSVLKYLADPYEQLSSIVFWTMGGLHNANWTLVKYCMAIVLPGIVIIEKLDFKIKLLALDDGEASTLGLNVPRFRNMVLLLVSFIVSFCVSISGTIGWVALIVPHLSKILSSGRQRKAYVHTAIMGASFLLILDNIARTATTSEIPIGILTAIIGAPVLGYLIVFKKTI